MQPTSPPKSLPKPVRHYQDLPDGRLLCYYTFTSVLETKKEATTTPLHPIVYLHGFPGCGYEGALCAAAAQRQGCEMYSVDRPGFGHTHPLKKSSSGGAAVHDGTGAAQDAYVRGAVDDVWHLAKAKKWDSFSVIGVSGGGPYSLAMLHSYLASVSEHNRKGSSTKLPRLAGVSVVAGVCCSAGNEGFMDVNKKLVDVVSTITTNESSQMKRRLCWYLLLFQFVIQRFLILLIPLKWLGSFMGALMKGIPEVDADVFLNQIAYRDAFLESIKNALRQSPVNGAFEATVLFRSKQGYEDDLRLKWKEALQKKELLPRVSIFHGDLDVNVPMAHSVYVYENLFGGAGDNEDKASPLTLKKYNGIGHVSLVTLKSEEIVKAIAPSK